MNEQIQIKSQDTLQGQLDQFKSGVKLPSQEQALIEKYSKQILQITDLDNLPEDLPNDLVRFIETHREDYLRILRENSKEYNIQIREYLKRYEIEIDFDHDLIAKLKLLKKRVKTDPIIYKCLTKIREEVKFDKNDKKGQKIYKAICEVLSEYENYSHLSEDEIGIYHELHKKDRQINNSDPHIYSGEKKKSNKAYEYIKRLYNERVDRDFIQSIKTVHWTFNLINLEKMLEYHSKIKNWDISTVGYKAEENTPSQWGRGNDIGILINGDVVWASNEDARSDNRTLSKGHAEYDGKKYSYGDKMGLVLNEDSFLDCDIRGDHHNEFIVTNWQPEAIVIDKSKKNFNDEDLENIFKIAQKYNLKVIDNEKHEIKLK